MPSLPQHTHTHKQTHVIVSKCINHCGSCVSACVDVQKANAFKTESTQGNQLADVLLGTMVSLRRRKHRSIRPDSKSHRQSELAKRGLLIDVINALPARCNLPHKNDVRPCIYKVGVCVCVGLIFG